VRCDEATERLSHALDGEVDDREATALDAHVASCSACRAFRDSSLRVRQHLRFEVLSRVPDVEPRVQAAVARPMPRPRWRWLAPAAAVVAGIVAGAAFIGLRPTGGPDVAAANLSGPVLSAQRRVDSLVAQLRVTERGWHPDVPVRTYSGHVDYRAPESIAIDLVDDTQYPSTAWKPNNVATVVSQGTDWRSGPAACPRESQPSCTPAAPRLLASVDREPFPDAEPAPLDLVVPVRSLAGGGDQTLLGGRRVAGRSAIGVQVTAAQVEPLLAGLVQTGNWRELYPSDRVELWLDRESFAPLDLKVFPTRSAERERWAAHRGYSDSPRAPVLEIALDDIRLDQAPAADAFPAPPPGAVTRSLGFRELPTDQVGIPDPGWLPPEMAPYRAGLVQTPNGPTVAERTWSDGRAWVKVRETHEWTGDRLFGDLGDAVRRIDSGATGTVYAGDGGRRIAIHGAGVDATVSGSLGGDDLLRVATSLGIAGEPAPPTWAEASLVTGPVAARALPGLLMPERIGGFGKPAVRVEGDTVTLAYTGAGAREFVLVQTRGTALAPPVEIDARGVDVRGRIGRYSPDRGELEWVERGATFSIRSQSLSLSELLRIAAHLEPV
jgi:putative zinc finger protein